MSDPNGRMTPRCDRRAHSRSRCLGDPRRIAGQHVCVEPHRVHVCEARTWRETRRGPATEPVRSTDERCTPPARPVSFDRAPFRRRERPEAVEHLMTGRRSTVRPYVRTCGSRQPSVVRAALRGCGRRSSGSRVEAATSRVATPDVIHDGERSVDDTHSMTPHAKSDIRLLPQAGSRVGIRGCPRARARRSTAPTCSRPACDRPRPTGRVLQQNSP